MFRMDVAFSHINENEQISATNKDKTREFQQPSKQIARKTMNSVHIIHIKIHKNVTGFLFKCKGRNNLNKKK